MDIETAKKQFGLRVKLHRTKEKLTQEQFAERIEIEQPNLSNIEKGKTYPSFETICNLIEKGGIESGFLFSFLGCNKIPLDAEINMMMMQAPVSAKIHIKALLKMILNNKSR